jgi:endonuclease/exonuclease/phosphatase family metal-dependent hydrolase
MGDLLTGHFAPRRWGLWPPDSLRVVSWNIDRGSKLPELIDFLASEAAELIILQEVDVNARRTGFLNVGETIARRLEMNYVFGREFQELTQGTRGSPALHGQATLCRWPLRNPRILRFRRQSNFWRPRWFLPPTQPFQERLGGRIALVTEVCLPGRAVAVYNLHLESRGDDALRQSQLEESLEDAARYSGDAATILAGDLNLDTSGSLPADALARAGFRSAVALPSPHTTTPRGLFRTRRSIDWAYVSGPVEATKGLVNDSVDASDHYPIAFTLQLL